MNANRPLPISPTHILFGRRVDPDRFTRGLHNRSISSEPPRKIHQTRPPRTTTRAEPPHETMTFRNTRGSVPFVDAIAPESTNSKTPDSPPTSPFAKSVPEPSSSVSRSPSARPLTISEKPLILKRSVRHKPNSTSNHGSAITNSRESVLIALNFRNPRPFTHANPLPFVPSTHVFYCRSLPQTFPGVSVVVFACDEGPELDS